MTLPDDDYDSADDFARSVDEAYRVVRERVAAGGPSWTPQAPGSRLDAGSSEARRTSCYS